MERPLSASCPRTLLWSLVILGMMAYTGCNMITFAAFMIRGFDAPAEFKDLKGKRVCVVCRAPVTMNTDQALGARELADRLSFLLQTNVPKITVIDQQDVADWTDENNWEDFREIGKALEAEMVVAVELDEFSLQRSASVYQGQAKLRMSVFDMESGDRVFDKQPNQFLYPSSGGLPTSNLPRNEFRRAFVHHLAELLGSSFYSHDPRKVFASDTNAISLHK